MRWFGTRRALPAERATRTSAEPGPKSESEPEGKTKSEARTLSMIILDLPRVQLRTKLEPLASMGSPGTVVFVCSVTSVTQRLYSDKPESKTRAIPVWPICSRTYPSMHQHQRASNTGASFDRPRHLTYPIVPTRKLIVPPEPRR